jgi:hypothetical protein
MFEDSPGSGFQEEQSRSFWTGYRYKCQSDEKEYFKRYEHSTVRAFQLWAIARLILDTLLPFYHMTSGIDAVVFLLAYIPNIAIATTTLLMVSFMPRCRKHVVLIISITVALLAVSGGIIVHVHTGVWFDQAMRSDLARVAERISDDIDAKHELQVYLKTALSASILDLQLALTLPQVVLIAFAGLWRSTFLACLSIPVGFSIPLLISPLVPWAIFGTRCVGGCLLIAYLVCNIVSVTRGRRRGFMLERSFQAALQMAVEASRTADSILNHTLKNTMADAAGDIEMFLDTHESSSASVQHLRQSLASLRKGMRSCRHRQAYLQLAAQRYKVALIPVNLAEFVSELTSGRPVLVDFPRMTVLIDPTLCSLILDNTLSNAFKHGHPESPDVRLTIACTPNPLGSARSLHITVSNVANPDRPSVTPDYVQQVLSGETQRSASTSAMSDHIGLQHTFLAAGALGARPSLKSSGQRVVFEMGLETEIAPVLDVPQDHLRTSLLARFPRDLEVYCLDDSDAARRLLHHNLVRWADTQNVHAFGNDQTEVAAFINGVLRNGNIAILDQHLEYGREANLLGTEIARQLVARGFKGLICMRSGNMAVPDLIEYQEAGAHCAFGKDATMKQAIEDIKVAYVRHIVQQEPRISLVPSHDTEMCSDSDIPTYYLI